MRISDWSSDVGSSDLVSNGRIGKSGYVEGYVPPRPDRTPTIAGFRFVTAQKVSRKNYDWVGLWVAEGNDQRTQIIGFNDTAHTVLANLPFRFGGMASLPDLHGVASHMTLIGEGRPGQPVPRSEEHTSELQSLMRNSYAVFCLKKKTSHTLRRITAYKTT